MIYFFFFLKFDHDCFFLCIDSSWCSCEEYLDNKKCDCWSDVSDLSLGNRISNSVTKQKMYVEELKSKYISKYNALNTDIIKLLNTTDEKFFNLDFKYKPLQQKIKIIFHI